MSIVCDTWVYCITSAAVSVHPRVARGPINTLLCFPTQGFVVLITTPQKRHFPSKHAGPTQINGKTPTSFQGWSGFHLKSTGRCNQQCHHLGVKQYLNTNSHKPAMCPETANLLSRGETPSSWSSHNTPPVPAPLGSYLAGTSSSTRTAPAGS